MRATAQLQPLPRGHHVEGELVEGGVGCRGVGVGSAVRRRVAGIERDRFQSDRGERSGSFGGDGRDRELGVVRQPIAVRVVHVIDDREKFANAALFPQGVETIVDDVPSWIAAHPLPPTAYAVIVTRGHRHDLDTLRSLATKPARYVGLIGSRAKVKLLFNTLAAEGVSPESLGRVHAPIGLDIGAITPQEIAVSILAEVIAVKHGKAAGASAAPISLKWDVPLAAADS